MAIRQRWVRQMPDRSVQLSQVLHAIADPLALLQVCVHPVEAKGGNMADRLDLPQGTLDLLILKALSLWPQHGWGISEQIRQVSKAAVQIPQGSLYPALHRLERQGWIRASWGTSDNNRRAKYYELTRSGRKRFEQETAAWRRLTSAVDLVLDMS
jgi:transcriptional regulator